MAATSFEQLIGELERSYEEVRERLADPAVYNDHREAATVGRRLKELEGPYGLAQQWRETHDDLDAAKADPDLRELYDAVHRRHRELYSALRPLFNGA